MPIMTAIIFGITFIGTEIGFRIGRLLRPQFDETAVNHQLTLQAGMLGLLALLLGFSLGMAQTRYDARKVLVIDEANAIDTAILRSRLLRDPQAAEIDRLLRQYIRS